MSVKEMSYVFKCARMAKEPYTVKFYNSKHRTFQPGEVTSAIIDEICECWERNEISDRECKRFMQVYNDVFIAGCRAKGYAV